jgi:RNA polymerase sigma-70 factor (ECF subfamily)
MAKAIQESGSAGGLDPGAEERFWIERARAGDRTARTWLIETHQDAVYGLAYRLAGGDPHRAEELAQEAFLRALRGLERFRGDSAFGTWMHRIVVNLHVNRESTLAARAGRRARTLEDENPGGASRSSAGVVLVDTAPTPAEQVERDEEQRVLREDLMALEEARRTVLVLRDLEGCSYEEIAAQLGIPVGTVRSRLFRAREELRERMLERCGVGRGGS